MLVFLTGGSGFVGRSIVRRVLRDGHRIRALVRRKGSVCEVAPELRRQVEEIEGDVVAGTGLDAVRGCDAVIHLVGIIREQGSQTFERVHHLAARNIAQAAKSAGAKRLVHMSALGTRADAPSRYHRTKWQGEEEVRAAGVPWVILRPSLIFGPGDGFVSQMADTMRRAPLFRPVPGTGRYPLRPIFVEDVAECFTQALTREAALGKSIELVGGEELSLDHALKAIASCLGVTKPAVHIPMPLMRVAAGLLSVLPAPPVTRDQLLMLEQGSTANPAPMREIFGLEPVAFTRGIQGYLGK